MIWLMLVGGTLLGLLCLGLAARVERKMKENGVLPVGVVYHYPTSLTAEEMIEMGWQPEGKVPGLWMRKIED